MALHRIEILSGPDSDERYRFLGYWWATYHPGDPNGESGLRERCQIFVRRMTAEEIRISKKVLTTMS